MIFRNLKKPTILIPVIFALFLGAYFLKSTLSTKPTYAGQIAGENIRSEEYDVLYRYFERALPNPESQKAIETIESSVWQTLILSRLAKEQGHTIPEHELDRAISKMKIKGKTSSEKIYANTIKTMYSASILQFEHATRQILLTARFKEELLKEFPEDRRELIWKAFAENIFDAAELIVFESAQADSNI